MQEPSTDTDDLLSGLYYAVLASQIRSIKRLKRIQAASTGAPVAVEAGSENITTSENGDKETRTRSHSIRDEYGEYTPQLDRLLSDPETLNFVRATLVEATTRVVLWEPVITSGKAQVTAVLSPDLFHTIAELLRDCVIDIRKLEVNINAPEDCDGAEEALKTLDVWLEKTEYILQADQVEFPYGGLLTAGTDEYDSQSVTSSSSEASLRDVVQSLAENVRLLMDLLPSIDRLPSIESLDPYPRILQNSEFEVSAPASVWISKIKAIFEKAADDLVARLGEANWQRFCRLRLAENQEISAEYGKAKRVFHPASTFYDSALGTSTGAKSDTPTVASHSSFVSSHNDDTRHCNRIPNEPPEVALGKPFTCTVCHKLLKGIRNRIDWNFFSKTRESFKTHVDRLHDQLNTAQREALIVAAAYTKSTEPQSWQCSLCLNVGFPSARKFTSHVCGHMEEIALVTLPLEMYSDDEEDKASNFSDNSQKPVEIDAESLSETQEVERFNKDGNETDSVTDQNVSMERVLIRESENYPVPYHVLTKIQAIYMQGGVSLPQIQSWGQLKQFVGTHPNQRVQFPALLKIQFTHARGKRLQNVNKQENMPGMPQDVQSQTQKSENGYGNTSATNREAKQTHGKVKCDTCRRRKIKCTPEVRDFSSGSKCDQCRRSGVECGPNVPVPARPKKQQTYLVTEPLSSQPLQSSNILSPKESFPRSSRQENQQPGPDS